MELSPEIKAQLAEQKKQCVFCKLISGEIPGAKKVFEDNKTAALLDIHPAVKGHTLYMLKEHYPMPAYIPPDELKHKFSLIPQLCKAIKNGLVKTGINVFIALGGAAGQQSYHFLIHLLPREEGDGFFNFLFSKGREKLSGEEANVLKSNFPLMMDSHFKKNPASWHRGNGNAPSFLNGVYGDSSVLYEDEKILCVIPKESMAKGHLVIYSKNEEKFVENLPQEDSVHLFSVASLASTLVFEAFKAHGTNIILKSGRSDDNLKEKLEIHVLPRWNDDHLNSLMWQPKQPAYDLDSVAAKIKDKSWKVKYEEKKAEEKKVTAENNKSEPVIIKVSAEEEIRKAIEELKR